MNKRQKIVQEAFLNNEELVIKRLKQVYTQSLKDITKKSEELQDSINSLVLSTLNGEMDEEAKKQLQSMIQSKVYQKQYQDALKKQVSSILDNMQVEEFKTVSEYLNKCYEEGFLGTMYDLHGQGIPLCFPLDQEAMVRAVQLDSKISNGLYSRLGEDVSLLKKKITAQVSRGIATGMSFQQVAKGLSDYTNIGFNNAVRIARTEGHRIQVQSTVDACYKAKEKGADVVKQWDSTLDGKTRESHRKVDGEIRELDEEFSNKLMFPGDPSGGAAEVVNCRCALLQRARWALDEDELNTLKKRAEYFGLDKSDNFDDFKKKYLKVVEEESKIKVEGWSGLNYPQNYKSKKEATRALNDKYGITFSDSRKYPIDETMICDFVSWMNSFEKQFPDFVKNNPAKVPKICVKAPSSMGNSVGYFQYYLTNRNPVELALNGYYHNSMDVFEAYEKGCVERKWTVANATFHKTFVHEYGHYVSNTITKMKSDTRWEGKFIKECIEDFKKEVPEYDKDTYVGLGDYVSRYGTTSISECFAESFAEYFGNENPRTFAKIFGKKLEKVLKGDV